MAELRLAPRYYEEEKTKTISTCLHYCAENGKDYHLNMSGELFLLNLLIKVLLLLEF